MPECIRSTNLLLLPGMMCDAGLWASQVKAISPYCSVFHGDITGDTDIQSIASRVLDSAPQQFALAGLSMGGIVAMEMWRQAPHRIERLALLDTNFRADTDEKRTMRNRQMEEVRQGALGAILRDELKPNYLARCHRNNTALLDDVLYMGMGLGDEVFIRQSEALRDRPDSTETLATITCSTLVLCGEEDDLCPPVLHREMAAMISSSRLSIIPECGHLSTMEQPNAVNTALLNWLKDNESAM
ncbi:MAG: alpha/beta fold hydrolase [Halioglobus sp.]